jgi:hypothetical protein
MHCPDDQITWKQVLSAADGCQSMDYDFNHIDYSITDQQYVLAEPTIVQHELNKVVPSGREERIFQQYVSSANECFVCDNNRYLTDLRSGNNGNSTMGGGDGVALGGRDGDSDGVADGVDNGSGPVDGDGSGHVDGDSDGVADGGGNNGGNGSGAGSGTGTGGGSGTGGGRGGNY